MALNYASSQTVTLPSALNSLATGSSVQSDVVTTGTSNNTTDTLVHVEISIGAITASASTYISIYAFGSEDGTAYPGGASTTEVLGGGNGSVTLSANGNNLKFLGTIQAHTASIVIKSEPMSIAAAFGGIMPRKWGLVIQNNTGANLASSGHAAKYSEVYYN